MKKKISPLHICCKLGYGMILLSLLSFCVLSCGDDDESNDSPNGRKGKKLVRVEAECPFYDSTPNIFTINYDSKGRPISIYLTIESIRPNGITYDTYSVNDKLLVIDYNYNCIDCFYFGNSKTRYDFNLNEKGYISLLANCSFTYNEEGYLTNVETTRDMWTFAYNNDEVAKLLVQHLIRNNSTMDYFYFKDGLNADQFYLYISTTRRKFLSSYKDYLFRIVSLIAYDAGLFGKTTKHIRHLSDKNDMPGIIEGKGKADSDYSTIKCSVYYE